MAGQEKVSRVKTPAYIIESVHACDSFLEECDTVCGGRYMIDSVKNEDWPSLELAVPPLLQFESRRLME